MKRFHKSMLGVTLLEIMLVLAIAAMIIVMSVRYYQAAQANQQANSALEMAQGIAAAADGLAQGTGTYSAITSSQIKTLMPNQSMMSPWGTAVTFTQTGSNTYTVEFAETPGPVCAQLASRLACSATNSKYSSCSTCGTSAPADFTYTYTANQ
jgi:type II secretory pathway pseudopilin PulG